MEEIWKPVKNYEELYEVSNTGRIRSLNREVFYEKKGFTRIFEGKELKPTFSEGSKCYKVVLYKDSKSKTFQVHYLVAEAFIPKPEGNKVVNHKDGCRTNNVYTNLEWVDGNGTRKASNKPKSKAKIRCITTNEEFTSIRQAEKKYNCDLSSDMSKLKIKFRRSLGKLPDGRNLRWEYI